MIKTDYKPKLRDKPIFSSSRRRSGLPVILMALIAFTLAVWGLWQALLQQTTSKNENVPLTINQPISEPTIDQSLNDEEKDDTELGEIQLNFKHEQKSESKRPGSDKNQVQYNSKQKKTEPDTNSLTINQNWKKTTIRSGDSMARVFQRLNFSPGDLHSIISLGNKTAVLKKVKPGKTLYYTRNPELQLTAIRYSIDKLKTLTVTKLDNKWSARIDTKQQEIRQANSRGTINSSLFIAGKNAGLTDSMVMELAGIFGWDIDFALDIREGDQFTVIYEEKYVDGDKIGNGEILAAEFINQGKSFKALLYKDSSGHSEYYTPEGLSMRKAFLRTPLDFSYISSRFNPRRFHPILKRVTAHNGVDYRAPKGTPVKAAGDGKVIVSAYSKYNGHHVFVQHGQKYITKYLHFSKRKVRRGQRVKQGQIIGYVGATGLAEAPHLHYEFLVNGVHRNPRTIKLPDAEPINSNEKAQFVKTTKSLVKQLKTQSLVYDEKFSTAD